MAETAYFSPQSTDTNYQWETSASSLHAALERGTTSSWIYLQGSQLDPLYDDYLAYAYFGMGTLAPDPSHYSADKEETTITKVTMHISARTSDNTSPYDTIAFGIRKNTTNYVSSYSLTAGGGAYSSFSKEWTTDPSRTSPDNEWTWARLEDFQTRIRTDLNKEGSEVRVREGYLEVTYDPSPNVTLTSPVTSVNVGVPIGAPVLDKTLLSPSEGLSSSVFVPSLLLETRVTPGLLEPIPALPEVGFSGGIKASSGIIMVGRQVFREYPYKGIDY